MLEQSIFEDIPLTLFVLLTLGALAAAVEIGFRFGKKRSRRPEAERQETVSTLVASALGLVAFLLAITFSIATSRYEDKRRALHDEVNTIGTSYYRADFLNDPQRGEFRQYLRDYVDTRLLAAEPGKLNDAIRASEELHRKLWATARTGTVNRETPLVSLLFQSLNQLIDLHTVRVIAGLQSRIPDAIWFVLLASTVMAFGTTGYQNGLLAARRSPLVFVVVVLFAIVIGLIMDLEHTGQGTLRISLQPMRDLKSSLK